jgi:hypothetical protein
LYSQHFIPFHKLKRWTTLGQKGLKVTSTLA